MYLYSHPKCSSLTYGFYVLHFDCSIAFVDAYLLDTWDCTETKRIRSDDVNSVAVAVAKKQMQWKLSNHNHPKVESHKVQSYQNLKYPKLQNYSEHRKMDLPLFGELGQTSQDLCGSISNSKFLFLFAIYGFLNSFKNASWAPTKKIHPGLYKNRS